MPLPTPVSTATWPDRSNISCTLATGHHSSLDDGRGAYAPAPRTVPRRRVAQNGDVPALLALGSRFSDVNVLAYLAAFGGGVVSFLSPCVLPLVPGYLSMVTGLDIVDLEEGSREQTRAHRRHDRAVRRRVRHRCSCCSGSRASSIGQLLRDHQDVLTRISGAVMLAMALFLLGSLFLRAPWLYQEKRFHPQLGRFGDAAPVVAGVAFGFGWSPCIGPILGSILGIAAHAAPRVGRRDAARRVLARARPAVPRHRARARTRRAARSAG